MLVALLYVKTSLFNMAIISTNACRFVSLSESSRYLHCGKWSVNGAPSSGVIFHFSFLPHTIDIFSLHAPTLALKRYDLYSS